MLYIRYYFGLGILIKQQIRKQLVITLVKFWLMYEKQLHVINQLKLISKTGNMFVYSFLS